MPSVSKHRKIKRPGVVIKRTQCPRNRPSKPSKPTYEKLKNNNHSLARALSQEKQESQSLFSQNVALIAEVHDLGFACKRRDDVILNIMKNAKEMLKMVVTMTNCLTNTISSCQEFATNPGNSFRSSASSTGRRDSSRRLSAKSPARGVVKPMVSGHTITKPTINLSRVNMQNIQNILNLTTIEEAPSSPERNPGSPSSVSSRSPSTRISDSVSRRQLNYDNRRVCRISEQMPVVMIDELDERRLSSRARISDRFSGRFAKRKSTNTAEIRLKRRSSDPQTDRLIHIKSPRVALSDVSKLLQNSQTVNVRMLEENSMTMDDTRCINSSIHNRSSGNRSVKSEKVLFQLSDSDSDSEMCRRIPSSRPMSVNNKTSPESGKNISGSEDKTRILNDSSSFEKSNLDKTTDLNSKSFKLCDDSKKQNSSTNPMNDDPMEGPSWLLNDVTTRIENDSSDSERFDSIPSKVTRENNQLFAPVRTSTKLPDNLQSCRDETPKKSLYSESFNEENSPNVEMTMNFARFVTQHRGHSTVQEVDSLNDFDDPTIMLNIRQQTRKAAFNVDDLQLPVIESSVVSRPLAEPEITSTINIVSLNGVIRDPVNYMPNLSVPRISDFPISQEIPSISEDELEKESSPVLEKPKTQRKRKQKNYCETLSDNEQVASSTHNVAKKKKVKHKSTTKSKDPSSVKVVLKKLTTQNRKVSEESLNSRNSASLLQDPVSDSESSNASSRLASSRPRRQKAPVNLQEPSIGKKLRRQD